MDIEGIVHSILPPVKGTSARGEWTKQEVILEQPGEFNRKACVSFWGDRAMDAASLKPGEKISVSVNIESREFNGRWYTELRAWKMVRNEAVAGVSAMPIPADEWQPVGEPGFSTGSGSPDGGGVKAEDDFDDLPF